MNNKDREHIGYLLSDCRIIEDFKTRLFAWDEKIRQEYDGFERVAGRDKDVDELAGKLMVSRYGDSWFMLKKKPPYGDVLEEARKEVYGEDYELIFGKN